MSHFLATCIAAVLLYLGMTWAMENIIIQVKADQQACIKHKPKRAK